MRLRDGSLAGGNVTKPCAADGTQDTLPSQLRCKAKKEEYWGQRLQEQPPLPQSTTPRRAVALVTSRDGFVPFEVCETEDQIQFESLRRSRLILTSSLPQACYGFRCSVLSHAPIAKMETARRRHCDVCIRRIWVSRLIYQYVRIYIAGGVTQAVSTSNGKNACSMLDVLPHGLAPLQRQACRQIQRV
jgi:hypothetical protein